MLLFAAASYRHRGKMLQRFRAALVRLVTGRQLARLIYDTGERASVIMLKLTACID